MKRNELVYNVLKAIQNESEPKPSNYNLEQQQWLDLVTFIIDNGYANIKVSRGGRGNKAHAVWMEGATLTDKGIDYLEENSSTN